MPMVCTQGCVQAHASCPLTAMERSRGGGESFLFDSMFICAVIPARATTMYTCSVRCVCRALCSVPGVGVTVPYRYDRELYT